MYIYIGHRLRPGQGLSHPEFRTGKVSAVLRRTESYTLCSRKSLPGHQVTRPCKDNPHCDSLGWTRRMVILVFSYAEVMPDD